MLMAEIVMAEIVVAEIVVAEIVMAEIVMAISGGHTLGRCHKVCGPVITVIVDHHSRCIDYL